MATKLKRFTISVTPEIEGALDAAKKAYFYNTNQNEMVRTLIIRGLEALKTESESKKSGNEQSA